MRFVLDAFRPLKTRVARRVFLLFVVCTLAPLGAFALYGSYHARQQIEGQARAGLRLEARSVGQSLVEHLRLIEVDLHLLAAQLPSEAVDVEGWASPELLASGWLDGRVASLAVLDGESGEALIELGEEPPSLELGDAGWRHVEGGETLIVEHSQAEGPADVILLMAIGERLTLQAQVVASEIWSAAETDADLVVLDRDGGVLYSSYGDEGRLAAFDEQRALDAAAGFVAWEPLGEPELAAYRQLFLEPMYGTTWTVLCSRRESELFATLASFRRGLLLTSLLTLWVVLYASVTMIRRRMVPIDLLRRAAHRMAEGRLATRVEISTDDEFRELGEAFNKMAQSMRERTTQLEIANRAKNEFLANMSHELRTPMTAILGYAEQCRDPGTTPEERDQHLKIVGASGQHLLRVINDILDVAKIEANRASIERAWCSPAEILESVVILLEPTARRKGITLTTELKEDVPEQLWTDPTRLRQILLNLVSNAVKFTTSGGVEVTLFRRRGRMRGRREVLEIAVRDTGIGMTPAQQRHVFEAFVQADSTTTRRFGGTGLGLSISRSYARLLGGDIQCASVPGEGSTFLLTLDLRAPQEAPPPSPLPGRAAAPRAAPALHAEGDAPPAAAEVREDRAPDGAPRARVLIAEDVAVNRKLVVMMLAKAGMEVAESENGAEALEIATAAEERGEPFDVILMDMQMPVLDGYEATRRLRKAGYDRPIIALTSHSMPEERDRCLEAGCDEFQSKPIDRAKLIEAIERCATDRARARPAG